MLRLSKKTLLALEAVVDIAYNARPEPVPAQEITRRQGVPKRYLEQVMQQLVHAGILRGVRGPRGGYRLAKERRRITMGDVVRVVSALEAGEEPEQTTQSEIGDLVVGPIMDRIQTEIMATLDTISIEDLCEEAERKSIAYAGAGRMDFSI
ncbi:MAG: Rrf2 family transcriptional regulator [Pseudomonadota bacterium]